MACRAPSWWMTWYPRAFRRPSDVWARLPFRVRLLRVGLGLVMPGTACLTLPMVVYLSGDHDSLLEPILDATALVYVFAIGSCLFFGWRIPVTLQRQGLSLLEARRFAYEAPLARTSFWSRPAVARLLRNDGRAARPMAGGDTGTTETVIRERV